MANCPKCHEPYSGSPSRCPLCNFKLKEKIPINEPNKESDEINDVIKETKYSWFVNLIPYVFFGIGFYLSLKFFNGGRFHISYWNEPIIKSSLLRGLTVIVISWLSGLLPCLIYRIAKGK